MISLVIPIALKDVVFSQHKAHKIPNFLNKNIILKTTNPYFNWYI